VVCFVQHVKPQGQLAGFVRDDRVWELQWDVSEIRPDVLQSVHEQSFWLFVKKMMSTYILWLVEFGKSTGPSH